MKLKEYSPALALALADYLVKNSGLSLDEAQEYDLCDDNGNSLSFQVSIEEKKLIVVSKTVDQFESTLFEKKRRNELLEECLSLKRKQKVLRGFEVACLYQRGASLKELSERYNLSASRVQLWYKKVFGHNKGRSSKLSKEDVAVIRELRADGVSVAKIAAKFNVYPNTIYKILDGTYHNNKR